MLHEDEKVLKGFWHEAVPPERLSSPRAVVLRKGKRRARRLRREEDGHRVALAASHLTHLVLVLPPRREDEALATARCDRLSVAEADAATLKIIALLRKVQHCRIMEGRD